MKRNWLKDVPDVFNMPMLRFKTSHNTYIKILSLAEATRSLFTGGRKYVHFAISRVIHRSPCIYAIMWVIMWGSSSLVVFLRRF